MMKNHSRHKIRNLLLPHVDFIPHRSRSRFRQPDHRPHPPTSSQSRLPRHPPYGYDGLRRFTKPSPLMVPTSSSPPPTTITPSRAFESLFWQNTVSVRRTTYQSNFSKSESFVSGITSSVFLSHSWDWFHLALQVAINCHHSQSFQLRHVILQTCNFFLLKAKGSDFVFYQIIVHFNIPMLDNGFHFMHLVQPGTTALPIWLLVLPPGLSFLQMSSGLPVWVSHAQFDILFRCSQSISFFFFFQNICFGFLSSASSLRCLSLVLLARNFPSWA